MEKFYFEDPDNGERQIHDTEEEAMAVAVETLSIYRQDAQADGEWSNCVEGLVIGRVRLIGATEDDHDYVPTHKATPIGSKRYGYDYLMKPVSEPIAAASPACRM